MYGGGFGFLVSLLVILATGTVSWWWLLWGSLIGGVFELCARFGVSGDLAEAVGDIAESVGDIASSVGDSCDSGGGDSGGDGGGGDGGGD